MANEPAHLWTLAELSEQAATALARDYAGPPNQRISELPNPRVIRYYTTLGLIDRAAAMRGRTALYHRRHLLQLVAIKRLQAEGLSIAEVQMRLAGLPDSALAEIARLPEDLDDRLPSPPPSPRKRRAFWKEPETPAADRPPDEAPGTRTLQSLELAPGAILLLEASAPLSAADVHSLRVAAESLLHAITSRCLTPMTIEGSPR